jgi:hypothetical protein
MQYLGWREDIEALAAHVNSKCFPPTSFGRTCSQDASTKWGQGLLLQNAVKLNAVPACIAGLPFT